MEASNFPREENVILAAQFFKTVFAGITVSTYTVVVKAGTPNP